MTDPIEQLQAIRSDQADPPPSAEQDARRALAQAAAPTARKPHKRHRGWTAVAVAGFTVVAVAAALANPFARSSNEASAADIARLADVAQHQRTLLAHGNNQYVLTRYQFKTTTNIVLDQKTLDAYTANAVAIINERLKDPPQIGFDPGDKRSKAEQQRQLRAAARMQKRADDRTRAGVKLASLPAHPITAVQTQDVAAWRNDRGLGAAGGLPSGASQSYGSPDQRRSAKILERAGIYGGWSDLSMSAFEYGQRGSFSLKAAQVKSLSTDPALLRKQLRQNRPARPGLRDGVKIGSDLYVFESGIDVASSPYASPQQRAAAILMLSRLPGVTVVKDASDSKGRLGIGVAMNVAGGTEQVVFDTETSQVLGLNVKVLDPQLFIGKIRYVHGPLITAKFTSGELQIAYQPTIVTEGQPVCRIKVGEMPGTTYCASKIRQIANP